MVALNAIEVVRDFCREQASLFGEETIRFQSEVESLIVKADSEGLQQILLNLFQNARRFQTQNKPVDIRVLARDEQAEICIEDDGEGVPVEIQDKVFDPFFTTSSKGTGLGLAISRKIAREMSGDLYFEPKAPGARFVLVLKFDDSGEIIS